MINQSNRFTQDSPIRNEIFANYKLLCNDRQSIIITPLASVSVQEIYTTINPLLNRECKFLPINNYLIADLYLKELILIVLPFTSFYKSLYDDNGNKTEQMDWLLTNLNHIKNDFSLEIPKMVKKSLIHSFSHNRQATL